MTSAAAVVLGLSPTGLYAVRELGRAGTRVLGGSLQRREIGSYSRYLEQWSVVEPRQLNAYLNGIEPAVLIPTNDRYIESLQTEAEAVRVRHLLPQGYGSASRTLLDKLAFSRLCAEHAIAAPRAWSIRDADEGEQIAGDITYPCIVKPHMIHEVKSHMAGKKLFLAEDRSRMQRVMAGLPPGGSGWLIQELIPGPESAITLFAGYVDQQGSLHQRFTARKLRQYPPGFGSASLVQSAVLPETVVQAEKILVASGYCGVAGIEFKRDPRDQQLKVIEVNPRPTLWFGLCHAAGKRVVETVWKDLAGDPLPQDRAQEDGIRWVYRLKDAVSAWTYRRRPQSVGLPPPELARVNRPNWHVGAVFSLDDPLPALAEPWLLARKAGKRLGKRSPSAG